MREKIKEIIFAGSVFLIISNEEGETPAEEELLIRRALRLAVREKGGSAKGFPPSPIDIQKKWNSIMPEGEARDFSFSTSLLVPKKNLDIKEVSYSDDDNYFSITIQSEREGLNQNNVVFQTNPIQLDGLFLMKPVKDYPSVIGERMILPDKDKIILLSETGLLSAKEIYELTATICGENITKEIATLILASLILETNNFTENASEENLSLGSALLGLGADKDSIRAIIRQDMTYSFAQLLGRALARTRNDKDLQSVWVFLSEADLQKTGYAGAQENIFYSTLKKVREIVPRESFYLMLYQKGETVRAIISSDPEMEQSEVTQKLTEKISAAKANGFFLAGPYANFSEAEIALSQALKDALR